MASDIPTLIISRHRQEQADDPDVASLLAATWNVKVLEIPFLYDLPTDSPVMARLRTLPQPVYFLVPLSPRSVKSLLDYLQIPFADVFETADAVQIFSDGISGGEGKGDVERLTESPTTRWYPVIDHSRCTTCLECVNYCLFGVYAIGKDSQPFVDQPDACRDGCPACSRVCPSQAIMFPLYEDRLIAGYDVDAADNLNNLIDLVDQI